MKVFLSWSGPRSQEVAQQLSTWLNLVIQSLEPWMSANNIDKGTQWDIEISKELNTSPVGIICLTRENLGAPWILFEAGALHKGAGTNRVCTLLIDLQPSDVGQPLAKFNHTLATEADMRRLMGTLNAFTEKPLPENVLNSSFNAYWPQLDKALQLIKAQGSPSQKPVRNSDEILTEVLELVRAIHGAVERRQIFREGIAESTRQLLGRTMMEQAKDSAERKWRDLEDTIAGLRDTERRITATFKKVPPEEPESSWPPLPDSPSAIRFEAKSD